MKTWDDYKTYVRSVDPVIAEDIDEVENISSIISSMVEQRNLMGLSQRDLATLCGISQSSVARIESLKITPNLDTLLKIFHQLGLKLTVTKDEDNTILKGICMAKRIKRTGISFLPFVFMII